METSEIANEERCSKIFRIFMKRLMPKLYSMLFKHYKIVEDFAQEIYFSFITKML